MNNVPLFSFAIVNWNTRDLLDECLASIRAASGDLPIEILVADNASSDGSAHMVRQKYPEAVLIETGGNLGFAGGHFPLFERGTGRYHVLVNSDVRLTNDCLAPILARLDADPDIGVLGCRILGHDGELQPSCRRFPNLWFQLIEGTGINRLFPRSGFWNSYKMGDFDHDYAREVDQVMGSFFVIRREVVNQIGPLDRGFFMYYEEVDYCLRAKQAGFKVFFDPAATVYHAGGASADKVKVLTIRRLMRSMRRYYEKNHGRFTWFPLLAILSLDGVTHCLFALLRRRQPLTTAKAYWLAWWDVLLRKPAHF
ncbi:glycosyltransferase family 2 protein [Acanthopleuribacter pedis]|uniref:Glycosyltransferase family 2 protein n=1 Tax=Acanthopleuribacter pedis TaxID=442870 RepID=A0A8J7U2C2_9BACT|nr:glycosyltransferase family 2 protein [Acanthopleuribacter pedis]MBO1317113.1 glycosyltransferase family 2 protein [Acanthopleuribacter pedis]